MGRVNMCELWVLTFVGVISRVMRVGTKWAWVQLDAGWEWDKKFFV